MADYSGDAGLLGVLFALPCSLGDKFCFTEGTFMLRSFLPIFSVALNKYSLFDIVTRSCV